MKPMLVLMAVLLVTGLTWTTFFTGYRAPDFTAFDEPQGSSAIALTQAIIEAGKQQSGDTPD